jgi:hypothetical protein
VAICERCGNPIPQNRRRYDRACCARYAAVLRYRERLGEDYLLIDAARKRLSRRRLKLRLEVGPLTKRRVNRRIGIDEARAEHDAIRRAFLVHGPTPEIAARAAALYLSVGPWSRGADVQSWADCAELWVNIGGAQTAHPSFMKLLKQIELVRLEHRDYTGLARVLSSRLSLHYQLAEAPYGRHFEQAMKLDEYLTAIFDGPLRTSRQHPTVSWLDYCHRLLRLRLALFGNLDTIARRYDELHAFSENDEACAWYTSLEGVRLYARRQAWKDLERCFDGLNKSDRVPPGPIHFNLMRESRTEIAFYLQIGERDSALRALESFAMFNFVYRISSDQAFLSRIAARFGVTYEPSPPSHERRLVLFPDLAQND